MTQTVSTQIAHLRAAMNGPVLEPEEPGYDDARRVWNAHFDRRPALIARCSSTADVVTALGFAREQALEITVRGGAHNTAGTSVCDGAMMIDLSGMNAVSVDPQARRAHVQGGALLGEVDAATTAHGLGVPAGLISHTGVAGLTLGGGMGWLTRKFGLTVDNLVSAEIVTADGQVRRVDAEHDADLFWGIRGGGGNFGIVTSFEFALHPVNPMVDFALLFWELQSGPQALAMIQTLVPSLDPELNIVVAALNAPPVPFVPEQYHFAPGYALLLTGFDGTPEHARVVDHVRATLPPSFEMVTPMPYVQLQQLLDEATRWGQSAYEKGLYVADFSEDVIAVLTEHIARKPSPSSTVMCYRLDGAFSRVDEDATAFSGGRSPRFGVFLIGITPDPDGFDAERAWVRAFWDALRSFALGGGDGYVNASADLSQDRVRHNYGAATYDRLAGVKRRYDPENVFHHNANILPGRPGDPSTAEHV